VHQLEIKALDIVGARCNHKVHRSNQFITDYARKVVLQPFQ